MFRTIRCWWQPAPEDLQNYASTRHVDPTTCAITPQHILAFTYLQGGVGERVIDTNGNFIAQVKVPRDTGRSGSVAAASLGFAGINAGMPRSSSEQWSAHLEEEFLEFAFRISLGYKVFHPDSRWLDLLSLLLMAPVLGQMLSPVGTLPEDCPKDSPLTQGLVSRGLIRIPALLLALFWLATRRAIHGLSLSELRKLYPTILTVIIVSSWCVLLYETLTRELVRMAGGGLTQKLPVGRCARTGHVSVTTSFATFPPTRTCIDEDQTRTVSDWPFMHAIGCETYVFDALFPRTLEVVLLSSPDPKP
jgi:hypothetical protein